MGHCELGSSYNFEKYVVELVAHASREGPHGRQSLLANEELLLVFDLF